MKLTMTVNGQAVSFENILPTRRLIDILREDLQLKGTKEGCGEGECGACTVIMDGKAVDSCLLLACQLEGSEIITIEGLAKEGELDELQEAFVSHGAIQCGYCMPGMVMATKALLMENPAPTEAEIRNAIAGNICRCSGYSQIVSAVLSVKGSPEDVEES
ncbi:MAG: (2Fe-2S)-binding protein [Chloroflexi bacterium]|nr:(2Fe-2S)-binding protein [Chloroflexota bacterium]